MSPLSGSRWPRPSRHLCPNPCSGRTSFRETARCELVIADISPCEAFEPIRTELAEPRLPVADLVSEARGSGRQKGITERYRGAELTNYLRPKVKLEVGVADRDVQTIVDTVLKHGRSGAVGDGKVFVLPIEDAFRVRTGESGEDILQAHPDAADSIAGS